MNILFLSAVLPWPLHSGGQIRMYNLLKQLSKRHRITLVSFIRDERERACIKNLDFCSSIHVVFRGRAWQPGYIARAALGKFPFLMSTYHNRFMRDLIADLLGKIHYDVVHIEPFYVWPSLPDLGVPLVVSEHNIEYDVYASYADGLAFFLAKPFFWRDVAKLKKWERYIWRVADALTAVSARDGQVMETYLSHPVAVVPNGVDLSVFRFRKPVTTKNPVILFVGNFRWHPNREAAEVLVSRIWPVLTKLLPSSQLIIAGRDIPHALRSRIERAGGRVEEHVEDIAPLYRSADMFVAPHSIGGGTKFKMLEAMATGVPVITTKQGMSGLDVESGVHYFEANTPTQFATQARAVWDNMARTQVVAANARNRVEALYDWNRIASELENVWKNAYAKR